MAQKAKVASEETEDEDVSFLEDEAGEGYEGVDLNRPRIKILQPMSGESTDESIEGAKPGVFFNTVTKAVYGSKLRFIPLKAITVWQVWVPQEQGGGFRGSHLPGSIKIIGDIYEGAKTEDGNDVKSAVDIYGVIPDELENGLVVLSLPATGISHVKTWSTRIHNIRLPLSEAAKKAGKKVGDIEPFYGSVWELTSVKNVNDAKQTYYTIGTKGDTQVERIRFINAEEHGVAKESLEFVNSTIIPMLAGTASTQETTKMLTQSTPERTAITDGSEQTAF